MRHHAAGRHLPSDVGAATHDRATKVHRPLTATLLWLEPRDVSAADALVIVSLDHCILDEPDLATMRQAIAAASQVPAGRVQIALTHTHGAGLMSRTRGEMPGGELIGPYLDELSAKLARASRRRQMSSGGRRRFYTATAAAIWRLSVISSTASDSSSYVD